MELWFVEDWVDGLRISLRVNSVVYTKRTKFQELSIFDTAEFGRILVLDNAIQTTEKDEYIYHESIAHVPLFSHPNPEKVLIIGGGDGGTLREVVRHPGLKQATMVDIDGEVIEASKKYLPGWNTGFDHPKAQVLVGDGLKYVAETDERFDLVLVDSTDPQGPGEALFVPEFYESIAKILRPGGMLCAQTESPIATPELVKTIYQRIAATFPNTRLYTVPIPSYPGGWWSFTCGSLGADPAKPLRKPDEKWNLKFYSPEIHERIFVLNPKLKADVGILD